jgi:hypothetical protein
MPNSSRMILSLGSWANFQTAVDRDTFRNTTEQPNELLSVRDRDVRVEFWPGQHRGQFGQSWSDARI